MSGFSVFIASGAFRGIYFPMMGRFAWLKVIAQNRRTIFKLAKEAVFGKKSRPRNPDLDSPYEEAVPEATSEASA